MKATAEIQAIPIGAGVSVRREVHAPRTARGIRSDHRDPRLGNERRRRPLPDPPSAGTRPRGPPRGGDSSAHHRREARDANRQSAHTRWQAPLTAALPGGRRLVPPGPSGRGRELPLGFEPVVPVGAYGLAPRQPEVVGVERESSRRRDAGPLPWGGRAPERHPPLRSSSPAGRCGTGSFSPRITG